MWILPLLATSPGGQSAGERDSARLQSALPLEMARLRDGSDGKDWPAYGETFATVSARPLPTKSGNAVPEGSPLA